MQSQQEQSQSNVIRLNAYRAKQTDDQRQRAQVAAKVNRFGRKLGLTLPQISPAIRIASKILENGCSYSSAEEGGINAIRIIAMTSANQRLSSIPRRQIHVIH